MRLKKYLRLQNSAHKPMSDITVPSPLLCTTQATIYNRFKVISSARTIQNISRFKHCEDSKHLNCDRGFYVLLTALQSVWYHFAPQALRLQLCCLRGLSRDEHSYGGMTVNPSFDFIKHTTDLCWVPVPHSAEHYVQLNTKSRKKNPCDVLMESPTYLTTSPYVQCNLQLRSYLAPGSCEPLNSILTGTVVADLRVCGPFAATSFQRETADLVGQAENSPCPYTHVTFS